MIRVLGISALNHDLAELRNIATASETRRAFREGAAELRDAARQEAPRGNKRSGSRNPGLLKRAIISFLGKRRRKGEEIVSFARVNVLKGRIRAPHAHLVEFGTSERRARRGRFLAFRFKGNFIRTARVRGITANPFFERAVSQSGSRVLDRVTASLKQQIERRGR